MKSIVTWKVSDIRAMKRLSRTIADIINQYEIRKWVQLSGILAFIPH